MRPKTFSRRSRSRSPCQDTGALLPNKTFDKYKNFSVDDRHQWKGDAGSLLDFAEKNEVSINFGCRAGNCGTCLTAVKEGAVDYLVEQGAKPEAGSCLACIAVPKTNVVLDA